jgi:hypothetical protein
MAHFVKIDENNACGQVIVVRNEDILDANGNESEAVGQAFIASIGLEGNWKQCSYNKTFRGLYPGSGMIYDPELDEFTFPIVQEEITE